MSPSIIEATPYGTSSTFLAAGKSHTHDININYMILQASGPH